MNTNLPVSSNIKIVGKSRNGPCTEPDYNDATAGSKSGEGSRRNIWKFQNFADYLLYSAEVNPFDKVFIVFDISLVCDSGRSICTTPLKSN